MSKVLLLFSVLIFSSFAFSQNTETKSEQKEISVCFPKITEVGKQSGFRLNYLYWVRTDRNGFVIKVKPSKSLKEYRSFMNDEAVIPCIRKWKLNASGSYIVQIIIDTTNNTNFLMISDKKETIKINL